MKPRGNQCAYLFIVQLFFRPFWSFPTQNYFWNNKFLKT